MASLVSEVWLRLNALCSSGSSSGTDVRALVQEIDPADLAAWLQERVANPAAERYLLELFFGKQGVVAGGRKEYQRFCRELTLRLRPHLERKVLGWGEISTVAELVGSPFTSWLHPETGAPMPVVYKKMPPFLNRTDAEAFVHWYREYNTILRDQVGIAVPAFTVRIVELPSGLVYIFVIQERVDPQSVGHELLRTIGPEAAGRLYGLILQEYEKLFRFNQAQRASGFQVGLDGQIPNWSVVGYQGDANALTGHERLLYLDTNVPMIRIGGQDVVGTDMYFQALPGAARWLIKRLNLDQEVMNRYFQMRMIMLDFLGNLIVRHRADLVPHLLAMSNEALAGPFAEGKFAPFTLEEVYKYYRSDVATWRLWRSLKVLGTISDGVSTGNWRVLRRVAEFYRIWTRPIF